jgi:FkbM family methyltransferase
MLRRFGFLFHWCISRSRVSANGYFRLLPRVAQHLSPHRQAQLRNSIHAVDWPGVVLPIQTIRLGQATHVRMRPHLGEFDFEAMLSGALTYENEVFASLELRLPHYDTVIEIGANVGVFTLFLALAADGPKRGRKILAFEPSGEAYRRLLENLSLNQVGNVTPFCCAIGDETKLAQFFEPAGHLTNGTLDPDFARQFSHDVKSTTVLMLAGTELRAFIPHHGRTLVKIDVEGAEARVLRSLEPLLRHTNTDVLLEVLPSFEDELNKISFLRECFEFFHVAREGLQPRPRFVAGSARDYFLIRKAAEIDAAHTAALPALLG